MCNNLRPVSGSCLIIWVLGLVSEPGAIYFLKNYEKKKENICGDKLAE